MLIAILTNENTPHIFLKEQNMKLKNYIYLMLCLVITIFSSMLFVGCFFIQKSLHYILDSDLTLEQGKAIVVDGADKEAVLDLNGYCIRSSGSVAIQVINGARLTIIDSNKNTTHYLMYDENTHAYSQYSKTRPEGAVEIQDGHIPTNKVNSFITVHGGVVTGVNNNIYGGAIIVGCVEGYTGQASFLEMQGGTVIGNSSSGYGGGVFLGPNAEFVLNGGNIVGNYSSSYGGGISAEAKTNINLKSGKIAYNAADISGGAVYLRGNEYVKATNLTIADSIQIVYNQAKCGGGIGGIVSTVTMQGGLVQGNSAYEGGGFDLYSSCLTLSNGKIIENSAEKNGGGIVFAATEEQWTHTDENNNVEVGLHLFNINGGQVEKNTADEGGGVYLSKVIFASTQEMQENIQNKNTSVQGNGLAIGTQVEIREAIKIKTSMQKNYTTLFIWLGLSIGIAFIAIIIGLVVYFLKAKR